MTISLESWRKSFFSMIFCILLKVIMHIEENNKAKVNLLTYQEIFHPSKLFQSKKASERMHSKSNKATYQN